MKIINLLVLLILFLTACQPATPAPTQTQTGTETPPPTETATSTKTLLPTVTLTPTPGIGSTRERPADGMAMVYVPEGEFSMGSNVYSNEQPVHTVYLHAYWIDQTEVTNAMYVSCVCAGACLPPPTPNRDLNTRDNYCVPPQYANYPVIRLDWSRADAYCQWAGGRLPTEAEWEKAARGTDGGIYPWGNSTPSSNLLNFNLNVGDTTAVGSYPSGASPYGAMDMAGNAWEWVADWYDPGYYARSPSSNPQGPTSGEGRVLRGGSWGVNGDNVRAAFRDWTYPSYSHGYFGFRCVLASP